MAIPKTIHQIWIGPKPVPTRWTDTWKEAHPAWEYRLWREADLDALGLRHRKLYDAYVEDGRWDGAADIARVEILSHCGGVYLDADTSCRAPMNGAPFLDGDFFVVRSPHRPDRIGNAVMGCTSGHPAMAEYQDALAMVTERYPVWSSVGAGILTPIVAARDDVTVLPSGAFVPTTQYDTPGPAYTGTVYATHHWGTTNDRY